MLEYKPWSEKTFDDAMNQYKKAIFTMLDLEVSGACNLACIYCETNNKISKSKLSIKIVENMLKTGNIKWVFVCGLGEPTHHNNMSLLKEILRLCKIYNAKCSLFTNLCILDDELCKYIEEEVLYILFKLDTFNKERTKEIYGFDVLDKIIDNIKKIERLVKVDGNQTNISASIVPTTLNKDELKIIIDYCYSKNIFPLIGQLEKSGNATDIFDELNLSNDELEEINDYIYDKYGYEYKIPICPSVICGINIDNDSNLVVDGYTGLSCYSFWLEEPKIKILLSVNDQTRYEEMIKCIMEYRNQSKDFIYNKIDSIKELPFGGCGGDIKTILKYYIDIQE